jgi:hypothetical protein
MHFTRSTKFKESKRGTIWSADPKGSLSYSLNFRIRKLSLSLSGYKTQSHKSNLTLLPRTIPVCNNNNVHSLLLLCMPSMILCNIYALCYIHTWLTLTLTPPGQPTSQPATNQHQLSSSSSSSSPKISVWSAFSTRKVRKEPRRV